jgi:hypothetical protein
VTIPIGFTGTSATIITTDPLGPCVLLLLYYHYIDDHTIKDKCLLSHYSYDKDETGLSIKEILEHFLNHLLLELHESLDTQSIDPSNPLSKELLAVRLVIAGGDVHDVHAIHHAFSLLNVPENQTNIKFNDDGEMNFFISKLINNIIIIKPTFKMLSDEELVYENYYPGLLIHFSCRTRNLILFIRWKVSNVKVDIGTIMNTVIQMVLLILSNILILSNLLPRKIIANKLKQSNE